MHAVVESLGGVGWDWQVWETAGRVRPRDGVAGALDEAKAKADQTLAELLAALADRVGHAGPCQRSCRFPLTHEPRTCAIGGVSTHTDAGNTREMAG